MNDADLVLVIIAVKETYYTMTMYINKVIYSNRLGSYNMVGSSSQTVHRNAKMKYTHQNTVLCI